MLLRAALICVLLSVCLRDNVTAAILDSIRPEDDWPEPEKQLTLSPPREIDAATLDSIRNAPEDTDLPEMSRSPPVEIDPADLRLDMNNEDTDLLELKKQATLFPTSQPLEISDGEIPTPSESHTTPQSEGISGEIPTPSEFHTTPQSEGISGEMPTPSELPTTPQSEETYVEETARLGAESLNEFFGKNCKECQRRCGLEGKWKFVCIFTCGVCTRFQKRSVQQPNDPKGHLTPMPNKFSAYDLDDDGVVSIKELAFVAGQGTDVKMVFDIADKDGDMQLTPQELYEGPFVFEMDVDESDYTYCEYLTKRMERSG